MTSNFEQDITDALANIKSEEMRERLRERLRSGVAIELDRAAGIDVSLGEQALKASLASIAAEYSLLVELQRLRIAAKVLFRLIGA